MSRKAEPLWFERAAKCLLSPTPCPDIRTRLNVFLSTPLHRRRRLRPSGTRQSIALTPLRIDLYSLHCTPGVRMQSPCASVDTSLLLRDILHHKETHFNSQLKDSDSAKDSIYSSDCNSEMISPLLHSKSSDMAYSARDNNDLDNEDTELANDNNSSVNDEDQSDDLDDRSLDASANEDVLKLDGRELSQVETKEAKRANVDKLLTGHRLSPHNNAIDSCAGIMMADMKRQKRKQPQPQQHDASVLPFEEVHIRRQIQKLEEQLEAMKRKSDEELCLNDDDLTEEEVDVEMKTKRSSPVNVEVKRPRLEVITKPTSPRQENGYDYNNRLSPGSDVGKRQKRKQTQPQQHDNAKVIEGSREPVAHYKHNNNNSMLIKNLSLGEDVPSLEDNVAEVNPLRMLGGDSFFRPSLYRGLSEKDLFPRFYPQSHRDNFFSTNFFMRPDLDHISAMRNVSKSLQARQDNVNSAPEVQPKSPPVDITKIANAIKAEVTQALSKAIDSAVTKVFNEKQAASSEPSATTESMTPQQHTDRHQHQSSQQQQQQQLQQQQQQQNLKHHQSPGLFPNFMHPHHQPVHQPHLSQPHQQQTPHRPLSVSTPSEREALKETVNNAQIEKKLELNVPFIDHIHFLERFGKMQQEKSAFEPISKTESDLITPYPAPALPFHPHFQYYLPHQALTPMYPVEPEQNEPLPLIVNTPKKKRTKVTDTRLNSPRGKPGVLQDNTASSSMDHADAQRHLSFQHFLPPVLPTSVAITNPSLSHTDLLNALRLRDASYGDSRIPSPQEHSRSSPRSASESPHFINDSYRMSMSGDLMDGNSPGSSHMISF
nr:signal transducer and activator of transcription C-like [Biomphalaria glabrata]